MYLYIFRVYIYFRVLNNYDSNDWQITSQCKDQTATKHLNLFTTLNWRFLQMYSSDGITYSYFFDYEYCKVTYRVLSSSHIGFI